VDRLDTDFRLRFSNQRNEVSNAPFLYERIGIVPTVEATVKSADRVESRTKEFFGDVFLTTGGAAEHPDDFSH